MRSHDYSNLKRDLITVEEAAEILGVSNRRVRALINEACPRCGGDLSVEGGEPCPRCRGHGMRLPAQKFGDALTAPWMITEWAVEIADLKIRPPGRKRKK